MHRPLAKEHNPYFGRYIDLVPEGDFMEALNNNTADTAQLYAELLEEKHDYRYADDKWTIKQVLMHVIDTERVMSYRALVAARGDSQTILNSMDENQYAANADVSHRSMDDLIAEFIAVRTATEMLLNSLTEQHYSLTSHVAGYDTSVSAWAHVIVGHAIHHNNVLLDRYLNE